MTPGPLVGGVYLAEVRARYLEYLGITDESEDQSDGKDNETYPP